MDGELSSSRRRRRPVLILGWLAKRETQRQRTRAGERESERKWSTLNPLTAAFNKRFRHKILSRLIFLAQRSVHSDDGVQKIMFDVVESSLLVLLDFSSFPPAKSFNVHTHRAKYEEKKTNERKFEYFGFFDEKLKVELYTIGEAYTCVTWSGKRRTICEIRFFEMTKIGKEHQGDRRRARENGIFSRGVLRCFSFFVDIAFYLRFIAVHRKLDKTDITKENRFVDF